MDFGNMLSDSFEYTKDALMEKWLKWILLIIPFMIKGYVIQIFKGIKPAPEINDWIENFINGIKLAIIGLIYAIPIIIVAGLLFFGAILALLSGDTNALIAAVGGAFIGVLICVVWGIILLFILPFAFIRFARTDNFGEAFNFSAILGHIGKIGWVEYIIALVALIITAIVVGILVFIISSILMFIPLIGWLLNSIFQLVLIPPFGIFVARYFSQVFDSVGTA